MLMQQVASQLTASFYRTALTLANDEQYCVCELAAVALTHAQYRNCARCNVGEGSDHAPVFNAPSNTRALGLTTRHPHCCTQEKFWNGKATTVDGMLDG